MLYFFAVNFFGMSYWFKKSLSYRSILIFVILLTSTGPFHTASVEAGTFTVVLDAGHGGKDPGAVGSKIKEKDINLGIVLKLGAMIKKNNPDVRIIYTRSTDKFVELVERARIANRNHADLFISVHTNAAQSKSARGTETYALGLAKTAENLQVAKRENSVILLEDDYSTKYEGFDPTSAESYIMFDFMQGTNLEQSINLAALIQGQFEDNAGRVDRGVRQAGFWVLRATGMPSVLIEVGYITNAEEERYLATESGRQKIAESIYNAFSEYKSGWSRKQNIKVSTSKNTVVSSTAGVKQNKDEVTDVTSGNRQTVIKSDVYKIQIMASPDRLNTKSSAFKGVSPVNYYQEKGLYKYTYGEFSDKNSAVKELSRIRKLFKDAFIVHFVAGEKVNY